jgi:hypothetical protein
MSWKKLSASLQILLRALPPECPELIFMKLLQKWTRDNLALFPEKIRELYQQVAAA